MLELTFALLAGMLTIAAISLQAFTITDAKITAIDLIDDPGRIAEAALALLGR